MKSLIKSEQVVGGFLCQIIGVYQKKLFFENNRTSILSEEFENIFKMMLEYTFMGVSMGNEEGMTVAQKGFAGIFDLLQYSC